MGKTIESNFNLMPRHGDAPPCIYNVCTVAFATLAFFIINALNINSASAASYVANYVGANISGNWVNITSSGNVSIDVVGAAGGALGVAKHTIYSETNSTTGYRLYVSSTNANAGTGYTSLYYDGDTTSEYQLTGINAATPASFSTANSWGYAVPDGVTTPAYTVYDAVIASGGTSDPSAISSLKWLGITKNYQPIMSSSTSNEGNPAATDVYYGVYADDTARKGSYRNLVVYTGFVEGGDRVFVTPSAFYGNKRLSIVTEHEGSANPITLDQVRVAIYNKNHPTDQVGTCSNITLADGKDGTTGHPLEFTCDFTPGSDIAEDTLYGIEVQVDAKGNGIFISYTNDTAFTYAKTLEQVATMQDATPQLCSNSPIGSVYHLKDSRTNASYLVTKMADGNCWMTQNLWLAANTEYIGSVGTSFSTGTSSNSGWNGTSTSGTQFYQGTHSDNTEDSNSNTGSFFTWKKATADTGGGYGQSGTVTNSVCPQGWKLPSGGSGGDFDKLYTTAYSSNKTNLNNHWSGSLIGSCYSSNCTDSQGSYAFWWASTQYSNNNGHSMHLNSSAFYPTNSNYKGVGFPVRCMLDTTPYDYTITYNANGGTGAPTAQSGSDTHVTISTTEPTRNGFTFLGWGYFRRCYHSRLPLRQNHPLKFRQP